PDLTKPERLRGDDLTRRLAEPAQLRQRRRVERPRCDAVHAERTETCAHLARRLVRERDGEDLTGVERAGRDLVRDATRDRRRLPRPRSREDANRTANGLDHACLLAIQPREDPFGVHESTLEAPLDGDAAKHARASAERVPNA